MRDQRYTRVEERGEVCWAGQASTYLTSLGCNHCSLKKAFVKAKSIVPSSKHLANLRPNSNDAVRCVVVASLSR
ncbi:hypothetical protein CH63R_00573 [Colletotrichum higginsianum IMI 349063]|uniref:Uncharacterized protein n=1 Tax=Colletotrichum higginsianum (strain IMI 349063) TaxID=759273 RepID=A0A1B7YTQ2_COLHI|nr:hypothetical protein CH63R_00573 [Colletotrichum higginsianum IMI 349063]OBR15393.1 hypothetical protein CH63R_00573 [Colletotrichum higginsianum IMI 349063]